MLPTSLGSLRRAVDKGKIPHRSVKQELRDNLMSRLRSGEPLFPGIVGYDDSVVPQVANAILSQHDFVLLGLRGQAKTRLIRGLAELLDEAIPVVPDCDVNDDPLAPICPACRARVEEEGNDLPVAWLDRSMRYVEKLATPDVTIADMIGDIDPIKAAAAGRRLSDELTVHYGLVPRANRCIFAINELPDLAGKIQVGLFNILQEGDIQIRGYPVRLQLDIAMTFTANPEDYTARGKIVTPLKDRIGSEIRTHYPRTRHEAIAITEQEAWVARGAAAEVVVPLYVREVVEEIAFQARGQQEDRRPLRSQSADADHVPRERRVQRGAPSPGDQRSADGTRHRRLRGAALHHRQVRAGIRGRTARGGRGRARADSHCRRRRFRRLVRRRRHQPGRRVVRDGGHAAGERRRRLPKRCSPMWRRFTGS